MTKFRVGRHVGIAYNLSKIPAYAKSLGYNIFQIFLGVPRRLLAKPRGENELIELAKALKKNSMKMVVHGKYNINLSQPEESPLFTSSIKALVQDLNSVSIIGKRCLGVVVHMGKNIPMHNETTAQALDNYVKGLKMALSQSPKDTIIILETGSSQGNEVGSKIDGLRIIYTGLTPSEQRRVMFCIDTCHIWVTGYDISTPVAVKNFFDEFNDKIGINRIACIHFNDSKIVLGGKVDRHADLGYGFIGEAGLKAIARFGQINKIPLITETPLDSVDLKTNRDIDTDDELEKVQSWLKK